MLEPTAAPMPTPPCGAPSDGAPSTNAPSGSAPPANAAPAVAPAVGAAPALGPQAAPAGQPDAALAHWLALIEQARASGHKLRIVGGNSKAFYGEPLGPGVADVALATLGAQPPGAAQVAAAGSAAQEAPATSGWLTLDTRTYAGIVAYEPSELVLTARAGTALAEVEAALAAQGQCLAFEPPHFGAHSTLGGAVAAGLSGPARASVGAVRDFVLGAHLVNGRGEYLEFGGQVMKNVAGYDVSRLLAGSLGSLGVLAQVSLKVLPVAPAEATLRFELAQQAALRHLARWRQQPLPLNASCWVRDMTASGAPEQLYLRLRGAAAAVEAACARLLHETPGLRLEGDSVRADWNACRDQTLPFFTQRPSADAALWRLSVAATSPVLDAPWPCLFEWHGALRWVWAPLSARTPLQDWARACGGHASLFRAPLAEPDCRQRLAEPDAALRAIMLRLKTEFDPHGLFNPGRWGWGL